MTENVLVRTNDAVIEVLVDGDGQAVVLLPSLGRAAGDYDDLAARLAGAGYRVLRPQPRGIGHSRGPMQELTLHDFADDVARVIEHLDAAPAVVGGHAFGNFVARTLATDHPGLVRGIMLIAATHQWPLPAEVRHSIGQSHRMSLPRDEQLQHLRHAFFAPGNDASVWLGGWHEDVMHMQRHATEATPRPEWWLAGTAAVLDIVPLQDIMTPPETVGRYREELGSQRVTVVTIDGAGHALLPEQPVAVFEAILPFLESLP
jgi:pimeloyl-ACP methyl ester carboxylesterase